MTKLTRKQIAEGLKAMPMNTLLLGASSKTTKLTHKQMKFAEEIAKGESKAQAYRKSHNSKGKPQTQSKNGQVLLKNPSIQTQVDAFKVAMEAEKYTTPAHLRSHIIHKLTQKTLDPEVPHAQQLKALELLGKITEVSLFTQRIEHIKTDNSESMREKLIKSLSMAMNSTGKTELVEYSAESLLAELTGSTPVVDDVAHLMVNNDDVMADMRDDSLGHGSFDSDSGTPTTPPPPNFDDLHSSPLHSIPDSQSPTLKNSLTNQDSRTITDVIVGEGVVKNSQDDGNISSETPPVTIWNEKG
jgi:phage terminase small subunit